MGELVACPPMGTEKRERQRQGRAARVEAARTAERKAANRRRLTIFLALAGVVAIAVGIVAIAGGDDDETATTTTSSPAPTTTVPVSDTVATGTPCVPLADPLPAGAPAFEVPVGPPPADLVTEDLVIGDGAEVSPGATVTLNYVGVSCSTGTIFDDSYSRGEPATFPLANLIQGWQDGIPGMRVGGQRLLIIPPDLGYGASGRPPSILGNETLIFFVSVEGVA
jgi:peptidylprolyl isomerase